MSEQSERPGPDDRTAPDLDVIEVLEDDETVPPRPEEEAADAVRDR